MAVILGPWHSEARSQRGRGISWSGSGELRAGAAHARLRNVLLEKPLLSRPRSQQLLRLAFIINLEEFWLPDSALGTAGAGSPVLLAPKLARVRFLSLGTSPCMDTHPAGTSGTRDSHSIPVPVDTQAILEWEVTAGLQSPGSSCKVPLLLGGAPGPLSHRGCHLCCTRLFPTSRCARGGRRRGAAGAGSGAPRESPRMAAVSTFCLQETLERHDLSQKVGVGHFFHPSASGSPRLACPCSGAGPPVPTTPTHVHLPQPHSGRPRVTASPRGTSPPLCDAHFGGRPPRLLGCVLRRKAVGQGSWPNHGPKAQGLPGSVGSWGRHRELLSAISCVRQRPRLSGTAGPSWEQRRWGRSWHSGRGPRGVTPPGLCMAGCPLGLSL